MDTALLGRDALTARCALKHRCCKEAGLKQAALQSLDTLTECTFMENH